MFTQGVFIIYLLVHFNTPCTVVVCSEHNFVAVLWMTMTINLTMGDHGVELHGLRT